MCRLVWAFAGRTYHIVWNLMHWLKFYFVYVGDYIDDETDEEIIQDCHLFFFPNFLTFYIFQTFLMASHHPVKPSSSTK